MIHSAIAKLVDGGSLSREEARSALRQIMAGEATPAQIGGFMTALRIRGETPEVIAGCAEVMRECCTPVTCSDPNVIDTCGTGGDGFGTFNISTTSAFVAAGAGATVAKHGNRSVSSKCGSADVLKELGLNMEIDAAAMGRALDEVGIAFLFAPALHPAMKYAIGPRRELRIRSIFNILGPLSNPAGARRGVMGVYDMDLVSTMAHAAAATGSERLFVVHGHDGLDEITLTGPTRIGEVLDGAVTIWDLHPEELGLKLCSHHDLVGGEADENALVVRAVLQGNVGPHRDIVLLNAAAAIVAAGVAEDFKAGLQRAAESVDSGAALKKLEQRAAFTQAAGASS